MPSRKSHAALYDPRPLVGFGSVGVIATIILLGLILAIASGIDVRFQILKAITFAFGGDATMWLTAHLYLHQFWMTSFHLGLIGITYLLLAFHIHPRRTKHWLVATIAFWAMVEPFVISEAIRLIATNLAGTNRPTFIMDWLWLVEFATNSVTAALLFVATRTWWIGAAVVGLAGLNASMSLYGIWQPAWTRYLGVVGHIVLACTLLTWAIRARVRYTQNKGLCPSCAYDRSGLPLAAPCPECGAAPTAQTTT